MCMHLDKTKATKTSSNIWIEINLKPARTICPRKMADSIENSRLFRIQSYWMQTVQTNAIEAVVVHEFINRPLWHLILSIYSLTIKNAIVMRQCFETNYWQPTIFDLVSYVGPPQAQHNHKIIYSMLIINIETSFGNGTETTGHIIHSRMRSFEINAAGDRLSRLNEILLGKWANYWREYFISKLNFCYSWSDRGTVRKAEGNWISPDQKVLL